MGRITPIKVMVVDDSQDFLNVACQWIAEQPLLTLVGTATNGQEALNTLENLDTDLVLMDAVMPVMNGFEATELMKARSASPKVVMLSMYETEITSVASGADGFVSKADFVMRIPQIVESLFCAESA